MLNDSPTTPQDTDTVHTDRPVSQDNPVIPSEENNRPISTISADSFIPNVSEGTNLADPVSNTVTIQADSLSQTPSDQSAEPSQAAPDNRPISTVSTDSSLVSADSVSTTPTDLSDETPKDSSPTLPPNTPNSPSSPDLSNISDGSNLSDNSITLDRQQAPQVQSTSSEPAPAIPSESTTTQSAEIQPKPPKSSLTPPDETSSSTISTPKTGFGEILSKEEPKVSPPPNPVSSTEPQSDLPLSPTSPPNTPSSPNLPAGEEGPTASFGDLLKKTIDTTINIEPVEPPQTQPIPTPSQPSNPLPREAPAGAEWGSPPLSSTPTSPPISFDEKLIKANKIRSQKREKHLNQILEFVRNKGQINNHDVRDLLHVSQSTATDYLSELVRKGLLKITKKAKATFYSVGLP